MLIKAKKKNVSLFIAKVNCNRIEFLQRRKKRNFNVKDI